MLAPRKLRQILIGSGLAMTAFGCENDPSEPSITLTVGPSNPVVLVGMSLQLESKPIEGTSGTSAIRKWSSSAPTVIDVDSAGLITAKSAGTATITAETGNGIGEMLVTAETQSIGLQAKDRTTCGIAANGDGYCWGYNRFGQAGTGTSDSTLSSPTKVAGGLTFTSISPGADHSCGTTTTGTHCWGCNSTGEIGDGTSAYNEGKSGTCGTLRLTPVRVATSPTFTDVEASGSVLVYQQDATCSDAICSAQTCAITAAGQLYCWGNLVLTPTPVAQSLQFRSLSTSMANICGLGTDAIIYCFSAFFGPPASIQPAAIQGVEPMQSLSTGRFHSCSIDRQGRAYCWGANLRGELGSPSTETCTRRIFGSYPCRAKPDTVFGGHRFQSISAGGGTPSTSDNPPVSHTCGVTVGQEIYCWGDNTYGELGNGTQAHSSAPVKIASDLKFRSVTTGYGYTCGVTIAGVAYCWGANPSPRAHPPGVSPNSLTPQVVGGGIVFQ